MMRRSCSGALLAALALPVVLSAQIIGPYSAHVLQGGRSLVKRISNNDPALAATSDYTLSLWVLVDSELQKDSLIAGVGDPGQEYSRYIGLKNGRPLFRAGRSSALTGSSPLSSSGWHALAVTFNGSETILYADGSPVALGALILGRVAPQLEMGPVTPLTGEGLQHFGGSIANATLTAGAKTPEQIREEAQHAPDPQLVRFEEASKPWPVQTRAQAGYLAPQDPATMPHSRAPLGQPVAQPLPPQGETLQQDGPNHWTVANNWRLTPQPEVAQATGAELSTPGYDTSPWMRATVPGTVLTTMVNRGVYPDPDFGLNNLAIPEQLNKQDYWYRAEFEQPRSARGRRMDLTFHGINYAAEVWLNGKRLGDIKGAFVRGTFNISGDLHADGKNALAVRISPPPHPGIPHEQSIAGGPGENGGALCLDGPTFVATEGWDWIPAIRDRNSGIWQDVTLSAGGDVRLGDPQVVTKLPLPDLTSADLSVKVPLTNTSDHEIPITLRTEFEGVRISKKVTVAPGASNVSLTPAEFPALHIRNPRLWWPNGYGRPDLYHLQLTADEGKTVSDEKKLTFGIREVTYELSLFAPDGRLRRVEVSPTAGKLRNELLVDVRHQGMRPTAEYWASTLTSAGAKSPAVTPVANEPGLTDLVLKVNGVRIAARGGNWGMDDLRKRVSRQHLEPYFRLHRDANVNIIRNWVGQDTEETFYQLADEYGLMVWNDFWASTQDYNVEPEDVPLFLRNARDVVARFRNHPSIVIWCGRNEGVPQPILNEGLIQLLQEEDGTRYYTPGSNRINLRNSGPYKYQDPALFYTILDKGFSVELGIPSLSTLESLKASMAPADHWPISDAWAYHDWHQAGNGDVAPFMAHLEEQFGAARDLSDFERKAQMFNYVDHRAIFEGFNQHLWSPNSGRMLWMTQPAWPSNMWQILSSDYDTQASFYGVQKGCEPVHVQLDLSDYTVAAVNTTREPLGKVAVHTQIYSLDGRKLAEQNDSAGVRPDQTQPVTRLDLAALLSQQKVVLVKLELTDAQGKLRSENLYWLAGQESEYRKMTEMPETPLTASAHERPEDKELLVDLQLTNPGQVPALLNKATLVEQESGQRVLPAYFNDNYVSLLGGETTHLTIRCPARFEHQKLAVKLRGWNAKETTIPIN